ncbi:MAG: ATP-dependent Clp protease ATP-binding subunit [Candidatus Kerfeldbacteria bacterium]|nr:ATP-dependent Clp protease ATP-binding subunit [Candidatus Kerfeldbacteria bacterium]
MPEFTWSYQYSLGSLRFRRVRLFIYRLVALGAVVGALAALVFAGWPYVLAYRKFTWESLMPPSDGAKLWWLALLLIEYAWYRLARERSWYPELPRGQAPEALVVDQYLSEEAWRVLARAFRYAASQGHAQVEPLHLLAATLGYPTGQRLFSRLGVEVGKLISTLRNALSTSPAGSPPELSEESKGIFVAALRLALEHKSYHLNVSELLLALAQSTSRARDVFEELAITGEAVQNITAWFNLRHKLLGEFKRRARRAQNRPRHALDRAYLAVATPFLNQVSRDLTRLAAKGYLRPCVARDKELAEVYRIIQGGQQSVVLVGDSGVGKSSVLEGVAQAMVAEEVPEVLQDKHLMVLSLSQLLSGASPAEAGQRLLKVVTEAVRAGNIVLGVEEIHLLASGASGSGGQLTLGDVLANAIAKHSLLVIATSSRADWRAGLEGSFLGQSLQPVEVPEPDDNQAIQMLESYVPKLEGEHGVFFSYGSLEAAVQLSRRYLPDRFLPEKAFSLVDEVAVYTKEHRGRQPVVRAEDVAQVVAGKVHVPLAQITQVEQEKLLHLEEILHQRIIGQDEAVSLVAQALRRARVGLKDQKKPVASFLFMGPTGVGKTELAKVVAGEYFGGEDKMIRLDMSEYQTAESIYRLVGAPGGVGEKTGLLTEAIRRSPYALLLLDEIEKAHADILNVFLQVLDDGRLTDATGRTVDFSNTIIIATSNAGTQFIQENLEHQVPLEYIRRSLLQGGLKQYFRPEFLNRFDGIVVFKPLGQAEVEKVTGLLLQKVTKQLEAKGIHLKASAEAIKELAAKGFDPLFGARPLKRAVQDNVDNALASYLISGKLTRRDVVVLEPGGQLRVEKAERL